MNAVAESAEYTIDRALVLEFVRVTEAAAIAASRQIGRGDENAADAAAVEAMRSALDEMSIHGRVVIGEGERDNAPMLYLGEEVGCAREAGPDIDIAVDPLEGTTLTAKGGSNALSVLAAAGRDCLLNAPDIYMEKIAVGPGYPAGIVGLGREPEDNVRALAEAKGVKPSELMICVLDRPRHGDLVSRLRALGCGIHLISDGDIAGVIATTQPDTGIDMYMGSGGAPEGVLAAAALRCIGGQFEGRLIYRNEDDRRKARSCEIEDLDRIYKIDELARGDCIFTATGVTSGSMLGGVSRRRSPDGSNVVTTHSVVMRASTRTVRWIRSDYRHS